MTRQPCEFALGVRRCEHGSAMTRARAHDSFRGRSSLGRRPPGSRRRQKRWRGRARLTARFYMACVRCAVVKDRASTWQRTLPLSIQRRSSSAYESRSCGHTKVLPSGTGSPGRACRLPMTFGTRCARLPFIRTAGTVQTAFARSNSSHRAPNTSPDRAAVRMVNSSARAAVPLRACNLVMKAGRSA